MSVKSISFFSIGTFLKFIIFLNLFRYIYKFPSSYFYFSIKCANIIKIQYQNRRRGKIMIAYIIKRLHKQKLLLFVVLYVCMHIRIFFQKPPLGFKYDILFKNSSTKRKFLSFKNGHRIVKFLLEKYVKYIILYLSTVHGMYRCWQLKYL